MLHGSRFQIELREEQNAEGIPREEIKAGKELRKGKIEERVNLVDIRTKVTNKGNYV